MNATTARERIQEEKQQQTGRLDLSALGLTPDTLPAELWELTHLEELNLGNRYRYEEEKEEWVHKGHSDLYRHDPILEKYITVPFFNALKQMPAELSALPNLRVLLLDSNQIAKIENLETLQKLQQLYLSSNQIAKIENLETLQNLQQLDLRSNQIAKIENLETLQKLQQLYLGSNQIAKIENLETLQNLQQLNLSFNQIAKIENLDTLQKLQQLYLGSNQIAKIENLETLQNLQRLYLWSNQIAKIENLETLQNLQLLDLWSNQIAKIENLETLQNLQLLDLWSNQIAKIENLETLQKLQQLNLRSNQIAKIENLETLQKLQQLDLRSNQIAKIENLETLQNLQQLNLSSNQIAKIENLETLQNLQQLNLSSNQIAKIENLETLQNLQQLNLSFNQIAKIENLETLQNLQLLDLWSNQIAKIENLETLQNLQQLNLSSNQIAKIENLDTLQNLQQLGLSFNQIAKIENLETLQNLQQLDLWSNQIAKIENLETLQNLQQLDLRSNQIAKIENLETLQNLQQLYLSSNQIAKIENLETLQKLQQLYLSSNQIAKIENLETLQNLQQLNLSSNQIAKIENLETLQNLQQLYLNSNQIAKIENLNALRGLKSLGLGKNPARSLPEEILHLPWLESINLAGNLWQNIPEEVTEQRDCLEDARLWFADLREDSRPNYELKLIVCGNGGVGKSTLIDYLRYERYNDELESTHAIQLKKWQPEHGDTPLHINIWDFGGQEIYHATHRLFMRTRALYLVLWDKETHYKEYYVENDGQYKNYSLGYWLDHIRSSAPSSPVIVVENKVDDTSYRAVDLSQDSIIKRFGNVQFEAVSAYTGQGVAALRARILEAYRQMPELGMPMPGSWHRCRQKIAELVQKEKKGDIDRATFYEICDAAGVRQASKPAVLRYLHNSGALFYREELFGGRIILNQKKAIEGIYTLFDRGGLFWQLLAGKGPFRFSDLKNIWRANQYPEAQHRLLLTFMEACRICFPRREQDYSDDALFIAPMFLPEKKPAELEALWRRHQGGAWHFRYAYEFMHRTFIHSFIVAAGKLAEGHQMWFSGIHFTHSFTDVLVESWHTEGEKGVVQISVAGQNRAKLLALARKELQEMHSGKEDIERFVSLNGEDFVSYNTLKDNLEDKNPATRSTGGKKLKTEAFRELMAEYKEEQAAGRGEEEKPGKKVESLAGLRPDPRKMPAAMREKGAETRRVILFLSANPHQTGKLQLEKEYAQVQKKLETQDTYKVHSYEQIGVDELIDAVADHNPHILHFAGHGTAGKGAAGPEAADRGFGAPPADGDGGGLYINDEEKRGYRLLTTDEVRDIFQQLKAIVPQLEMMVFNACFSEAQARAVSELGITVVGIRDTIPDAAAIGFASGFYRQLGKGDPLERSLKVGRAKARAGRMGYADRIVLYKKGKPVG